MGSQRFNSGFPVPGRPLFDDGLRIVAEDQLHEVHCKRIHFTNGTEPVFEMYGQRSFRSLDSLFRRSDHKGTDSLKENIRQKWVFNNSNWVSFS
ncbi:hypothetical protein AVEN_71338-1 [Araneus ventricosus]|uniref:Uncharacterized protein n=1 Tax=Araneus ventricosus TaxID=182803 RepID=A0A4Y2BHZ6_ARAVE|nr:hypothetical protein AVEN_71338-1 [Araneus ventricosus]